jgi:hypothetical protein
MRSLVVESASGIRVSCASRPMSSSGGGGDAARRRTEKRYRRTVCINRVSAGMSLDHRTVCVRWWSAAAAALPRRTISSRVVVDVHHSSSSYAYERLVTGWTGRRCGRAPRPPPSVPPPSSSSVWNRRNRITCPRSSRRPRELVRLVAAVRHRLASGPTLGRMISFGQPLRPPPPPRR